MRNFIAAALIAVLPVMADAALTITNRSDLASGTSTSLTYVVSVTGSNVDTTTGVNVTGYFGSSDGLQVPAFWGITTTIGTNVVGTLLSNTVFGTLPQKTYWFSATAGNESSSVWATSSGTFITPTGGGGAASGNTSTLAPSGNSVTNLVMPITSPSPTNIPWMATNGTTNMVLLSTMVSNLINQVSNITASAVSLSALVSNNVNQLSIINSNLHRNGYP